MAKSFVRNNKRTQTEAPPRVMTRAEKSAASKRRPAAKLEAKTEAQGHYLHALGASQIVFAIGPAGTGKTYVAASFAAQEMALGNIEKIILTRPAQEVGEKLGFLPGELEEKYAPYLRPFRDTLIERMGQTGYEYFLKTEQICPEPIGFMRGATFNDAIVILDEAQNVTPSQMKMFLTRMGRNCVLVIDGDPDQCDIEGPSGLMDAVNRLEGIKGVSVVEFTTDDIVRNGLIKDILLAYRN